MHYWKHFVKKVIDHFIFFKGLKFDKRFFSPLSNAVHLTHLSESDNFNTNLTLQWTLRVYRCRTRLVLINTSECLIVDIENMAMHRDSLYQIVKFWGNVFQFAYWNCYRLRGYATFYGFYMLKLLIYLLYPSRGRSGGGNNTTKCQPVCG